jgi:hypothetical protein
MTDTPEPVAAIAAKLLGTVNAPDQEIYRVSREIAEMFATRPADDLVRQLVDAIDGLLNSMGDKPVCGGDGQTFMMTLPSAEAWNTAIRARTAARAAGYGGDHG